MSRAAPGHDHDMARLRKSKSLTGKITDAVGSITGAKRRSRPEKAARDALRAIRARAGALTSGKDGGRVEAGKKAAATRRRSAAARSRAARKGAQTRPKSRA
jgi:hypothetical protein